MSIPVRPLSTFPPPETPAAERKRARFIQPGRKEWNGNYRAARETPIGLTLSELDYELERIGARDAVLEMDVRERDIRLDGGVRSDARPASPRVVLSFVHPDAGPLRYPADRYDRWEDNVRAIRLALEALRAVDRYGITRRAEQYAGWRALPASTGATLTAEAAARLVVANDPETAGWDSRRAGDAVKRLLTDRMLTKVAVRRAMAAAHPDVAGPTREEMFKVLGQARAILDAHHGRP